MDVQKIEYLEKIVTTIFIFLEYGKFLEFSKNVRNKRILSFSELEYSWRYPKNQSQLKI